MPNKKSYFAPDNPLLRRTGADGGARGRTAGDTPESKGLAAREATHQSTVFLEARQVDWLDDRHREISRSGGAKTIKKAAIIRALVAVAMESPINLHGVGTERELVDRIRDGLRAGTAGQP